MFSGIAELQPLFQKTAVRPCRSWAGARRFWKCLEALSRFAGGSGPFRRFRRSEGHFLRGSAWPLRILMGCGSFRRVWMVFSGSESSGARFRGVFSARFWRLLPWSVDLLTLAVTRPRPGTCWPKEIWRVNLPCEVWTPEICTSFNGRGNCTFGIKSAILGFQTSWRWWPRSCSRNPQSCVAAETSRLHTRRGVLTTWGSGTPTNDSMTHQTRQWLMTHHLFQTPLPHFFLSPFWGRGKNWLQARGFGRRPRGSWVKKCQAGWRELAGKTLTTPYRNNIVLPTKLRVKCLFSTKAVFSWEWWKCLGQQMGAMGVGNPEPKCSKNGEFFLASSEGMSECHIDSFERSSCQSCRHFPQTWLKTENSGKLLPEMKYPMVLKCLWHLQLTHIWVGCPLSVQVTQCRSLPGNDWVSEEYFFCILYTYTKFFCCVLGKCIYIYIYIHIRIYFIQTYNIQIISVSDSVPELI